MALRGEYFGAFPSVDLDLLAKGWHVAYLDCSNTFGSPETMKRWAIFYDLLTNTHGLAKKPVLLGMSRGGLYVYHWAAAHPDQVGLIYGDIAGLRHQELARRKTQRQGQPRGLGPLQKSLWF